VIAGGGLGKEGKVVGEERGSDPLRRFDSIRYKRMEAKRLRDLRIGKKRRMKGLEAGGGDPD